MPKCKLRTSPSPMGRRSETINEALVFLYIQVYEQGKGNDILTVLEAVMPKSFPWVLTLKNNHSYTIFLETHIASVKITLKKSRTRLPNVQNSLQGFAWFFFFFFLPDSFNKKRRIVFEPLASPKLDLGKEKMFYFYFMERTSSK